MALGLVAVAAVMAASILHSATNSANAIGAWAGGLVLSSGAGYAAIGWVGAAMAVGGVILACVSAAHARSHGFSRTAGRARWWNRFRSSTPGRPGVAG